MPTTSRDRILQRVSAACSTVAPALPPPVPAPPVEDRLAVFARALETLGGELVLADDVAAAAARLRELVPESEALWFIADRPLVAQVAEHLPAKRGTLEQMADCLASLTEAQYVIADTATVGLPLDAGQPRSCYLLPEVNIVVARREGMLLTLAEALADLEQRGDLPTGFVFVTGPSRTADIEKTLVIPAHGPKRLIVVLLTDA
jgi:L-lactate dehydrogenase complex protein LldG